MEKSRHLEMLLENYNDGRKKTFYCQAVNLLTLQDIRDGNEGSPAEAGDGLSLKGKGQTKAGNTFFWKGAGEQGIELKLRENRRSEVRLRSKPEAGSRCEMIKGCGSITETSCDTAAPLSIWIYAGTLICDNSHNTDHRACISASAPCRVRLRDLPFSATSRPRRKTCWAVPGFRILQMVHSQYREGCLCW